MNPVFIKEGLKYGAGFILGVFIGGGTFYWNGTTKELRIGQLKNQVQAQASWIGHQAKTYEKPGVSEIEHEGSDGNQDAGTSSPD